MRALTKKEVRTLAALNSVASILIQVAIKRRFGWKGVGIFLLLQSQSDLGTLLALHRVEAINWTAIRKPWCEARAEWAKSQAKLAAIKAERAKWDS